MLPWLKWMRTTSMFISRRYSSESRINIHPQPLESTPYSCKYSNQRVDCFRLHTSARVNPISPGRNYFIENYFPSLSTWPWRRHAMTSRFQLISFITSFAAQECRRKKRRLPPLFFDRTSFSFSSPLFLRVQAFEHQGEDLYVHNLSNALLFVRYSAFKIWELL